MALRKDIPSNPLEDGDYSALIYPS